MTVQNFLFDELHTGQQVETTSRLNHQDVRTLGEGLWPGTMLVNAVCTELPGPGTQPVAQELIYQGSVAIGDVVTITLEVVEKDAETGQAVIAARAVKDTGDPVISGQITVRVPTERINGEPGSLAGTSKGRRRQLHRLLRMADDLTPMRVAVVHPVDALALQGAMQAAEHDLMTLTLVGPEHKIRTAADEAGLELGATPIIDVEHSHQAAEVAVDLARRGEVEGLMKGSLHTDELMGAVVSRQKGLRTERRISHVYAMDVPTYPRPLLISDAAINIAPNLACKRDICQNAIELAHALGVAEPKVAILSATESVNPEIPSTLDAAALCKMADRGQITGGLLDGPLAFDNAISESAARTKRIHSRVAGNPDILIAPDLESGNMMAKQLYYLADAEAAGIVLGARVPIVLTSRADDVIARLASCAIALLVADRQRRGLAHL
ncbi:MULTISPECIES: bifunctional enoyl-CoA hydratase/phosphate acetyltransferase [unclassified Halorhodospira]|uniref:bifunctional enoyl-CoA hydratase/phosphate acetyltransferase n=1 Tax=unclassified Halorhodospira TaxID=2626748 RepID=UPI001EE88C48|nr:MULTISPECIES: bifunctional enoyl-CoA hydratase/phosphate acetyltransferase [unclassified Halorhodospira]MCG5541533.1 bifunctional enoyl-CoA hydratase/phosphate acetyltransferase [Halorhodospira sp. M39old]MCG5546289.1 bifunctional enoyl-CoA hydratase/phosphate acetyltransferase [Halorhodospira sp. M38]